MKCFVDANVFISLIYDEFGSKNEYMSYRSKEFFDRVLDCNHNLLISNAVIDEICKVTKLTEKEISSQLYSFKDKIKLVSNTKRDLEAAINLNRQHHVGKLDCLHFITARKEGCDCIVTWNRKDFVFQDELEVLYPSEL